MFRKRQPVNETELDALENAYSILDAALTYSSANVQAFIKLQGIELVFRCLKERVHAGGVALKWLDFTSTATTAGLPSSSEQQSPTILLYQEACQHMVHNASALKYLLPLWMARNLPKPAILDTTSKKEAKRRKKEWGSNLEETTIRILYALTRFLPDNDPHDSKARLIGKFADGEDKCERLVELLLAYDEKARTAEYNFYRSDVEESLPNEEAVQLAALEAKLAGGGDLFHRLGAIAAFLCCASKVCHETILRKLRQQKSGIGVITAAIEEFVSVLGDSDQKDTLETYLEKLLL
jgi:beta-catenin-like protein 1